LDRRNCSVFERRRHESTHGYHPVAGDSADLAGTRLFSDMLVLGAEVPDVIKAHQHVQGRWI
jgi:hypothetical protein